MSTPIAPATVSLVTTSRYEAINDLPAGFEGPHRYVNVIAAVDNPWGQNTVFVDDRLEDESWDRYVVGLLDGAAWWAVDVPPESEDPSFGASVDLRQYHAMASEGEWLLAGRALQTVEWARTHRFCGRCATPTAPSPGERGLKCPTCGLVNYPRVAPAMITLVTRGPVGDEQEALLARGARFPIPMYSCLAGFVEPGEDLEGAVIREVAEEVGVQVDDVRYVGSQPWPFPHSLMVGFRCDYVGGDIVCEEDEILDAKWYAKEQVRSGEVLIPPRISIAGKIIEAWLAE
ncbi:MAG: NAD(+) diphosphatase [Actinomycetota bacterium]